jgi:phosphoribosylformylglycinamidine cyclo-ligase
MEVAGRQMDVGKLLLSPTRTYLPLLREVLARYQKHIHSVIHCTGGGQTKVLKFARNVHIVKDNLLEIPPLFTLIQESGGTDWREMYQVFNMGHRMELYLPPRYADRLVELAQEFGIEARVIGRVEAAIGEKVTVQSPYGSFSYSA